MILKPHSFVFKMNARNTRDFSNPHSQFFSASQSLRRAGRPVGSGSLSAFDNPQSFESAQSDEQSIFNAIRVATPDPPSTRFYASLNQDLPVTNGLAVNMARFVLTDSHTSSSVNEDSRQKQRPTRKPSDHRKILSEQQWHPAPRRKPCPKVSRPDTLQRLHRKAVSLGATDNVRGPIWPGTAQPAIIITQPRYPPPERSPTPPGLPSFGSPEAMRYSARFLMRDNGAYARAERDAGSQRSSSYSETIRRFFGLSVPTTRIDARSVTGIGRAEDGTMVQGRFPYRQSGHGTNVVRSLHDHPFHHRLSPAEHETVDTCRDPYDTGRAKSLGGAVRTRPFQSSHLVRRRSLTPGRGFSFPSSPTSAMIAGPRQPRPVALSGLPRDLSAPVGLSGAPADQAESSIQGSRDNSHNRTSVSSRLHSALSTVREDRTNGGPQKDSSVYSAFVCWIRAQPCYCGCWDEHEEPNESVGQTSSHDTYTTARSEVSPTISQNGNAERNPSQVRSLQSWVSSVYSATFPTLVDPATV